MMTSALPEAGSLPAAPRAGADLRAARERLGWPIEDVSRALRIRLPHLGALEEGRIDLLPGNAYAVGFLRTYAKTLGLDPDEIARRFKAEASEVNRRTELVFPAPMPQRGVPAGAVMLLGVVLAIGAYVGWYRLSADGRLPAEAVAPVPQRLATLAEQLVPPARPVTAAPVGVASTSAAGAGTTAGATMSGPVTLAAGSPGAAGAGTAAAASRPAVPGTTVVVSAPATAAPAQPTQSVSVSPTSAVAAPVQPMALPAPPVAAAAPVPAPVPAAAGIMLEATANAWMEVRDRDSGTVLLNRVLHSGDTWPVPARPDLLLTTGNAGGTEIVVGGVAYPVPGGAGAVRRDLPLDADLIRQSTAAAQPLPGAPGQSGVAPATFTRPANP